MVIEKIWNGQYYRSMNKENLWYIILLPILMIILIIMSAISMSKTQFEQFNHPEGIPLPAEGTQTTP
jgi:uncharacterized membrane protein